MFFPAERPADPACRELRALHRAMNTPVVAIEQMPVGPASAAVALHRVPEEGVSLTIAIRSVASGQTLFFTPGEELLELGSPSVALDAALSFAESMGFLFDDEEVAGRGGRGPVEAARLWREFIDEGGEADLPLSLEQARETKASREAPRPAAPPPPSEDADPEPLWLSEPLPGEEEVVPPPPPPRQAAAPRRPRVPRRAAARAAREVGWEDPAGKGAPSEPGSPGAAARRPEADGAAAPAVPERGGERLLAVLEETSVERVYAAPPPKPRLTKFRAAPPPRRRAGDSAGAAAPGGARERRRAREGERLEPAEAAPLASEASPPLPSAAEALAGEPTPSLAPPAPAPAAAARSAGEAPGREPLPPPAPPPPATEAAPGADAGAGESPGSPGTPPAEASDLRIRLLSRF
jgi:hypothetical protein